jgi:hypothetical protein
MKVILGTSNVPTPTIVFIIILFVTLGILLTTPSLLPQFTYAHQIIENELIENTLETLEKATSSSLEITESFQLENITNNSNNVIEGTESALAGPGQTIEEAGDPTVILNETNSNIIEQLKPISDEMLKYAEEIFPTLNDPTLSRNDKVMILNQQFTDPESFLQNWRNLRDSIDSLDDHLNEVQEKLYIECTVNKESGVFNKTLDCTKWSAENAKGAPVPIY